ADRDPGTPAPAVSQTEHVPERDAAAAGAGGLAWTGGADHPGRPAHTWLRRPHGQGRADPGPIAVSEAARGAGAGLLLGLHRCGHRGRAVLPLSGQSETAAPVRRGRGARAEPADAGAIPGAVRRWAAPQRVSAYYAGKEEDQSRDRKGAV